MPVIRVEMFKRTQEQKRDLARELTDAFIRTCGGNKEAIKILITEVDENNWASGGIITSLLLYLLKNKPHFLQTINPTSIQLMD